MNPKTIIKTLLLSSLFMLFAADLDAARKRKKKPRFKPYIMAMETVEKKADVITDVKAKLVEQGFVVAGEYQPTDNASVIAVTHPVLQKIAAETQFGGYGSVIRVGVTQVDDKVQVAYMNPTYMSYAFRMNELTDVKAALTAALGEGKTYGSKRGITKNSLSDYTYMMFMPEFTDHDELASFADHKEALATINANLAANKGGMSKVFEVSLPGKDETLIGVGITKGDGADKLIMDTIDGKPQKHTPHLPYAVLVSGDTAYALAGKFRIAIAFPDLGMGDFMEISDAPDAIKDSFTELTKK
ncbi:MAG: hypothetical protein V2I33_10455 [Kangiellaceae bacterium]|jgi:hypothetical protein|nr:hypothetical protein [Kangiellaceae bacterium]